MWMNADPDTTETFLERIRVLLKEFLGRPITRVTQNDIDSTIAMKFMESEAAGDLLMPFDGMRLMGGRLDFEKVHNNRVDVRWSTTFFPCARFLGSYGQCIALGFFGEYDLYIGLQAPLPPTLIARYGNDPSDYLTYNPALLGVDNVQAHGEFFAEALRRAAFINADLGLELIQR